MVVLSISNCPLSLRGDLSKWFNEINTGVYIGKLSGRVRDEVWKRVCENIKDGQATMIYSAANAQGFEIVVHNTSWKPMDYDGITLMKRPLKQEGSETQASNEIKEGFSKAAKYEMAKRRKKSAESEAIILDVETTGLDPEQDRIIEIGALKIASGKIIDSYQCFVDQKCKIPENIERLTGITNKIIVEEGIPEKTAVERLIEFIGTNKVIGYNIKFDVSFLSSACERNGIDINIRKTRDVLDFARREIEDIENYKLETVAKYFKIEIEDRHRAISDCKLVLGIYSKLNKY